MLFIKTNTIRYNCYSQAVGNSKNENSIHLPESEGRRIWAKNGEAQRYELVGKVDWPNHSVDLALRPSPAGEPLIFLDKSRGTFRLGAPKRQLVNVIENDGSSRPLTEDDDILARPLALVERAGLFHVVSTNETRLSPNIKRTRRVEANTLGAGLTITRARELLAVSLGVRPDQIEISVRA